MYYILLQFYIDIDIYTHTHKQAFPASAMQGLYMQVTFFSA